MFNFLGGIFIRVQEVILEDYVIRYLLVDSKGYPVLPVIKYLKYLDKTMKSSNTQKTYCYSLKHYFTYLEESNVDYKTVKLEDFIDFVGWLRSPYESLKVSPIHLRYAKRSERTINLTITVLANFYDYLYRIGDIHNDVMENLMKTVFTGSHTRYKSFLHHVDKDKPSVTNILKIKEPRKKIQILKKEEVAKILAATTNLRDKFLIQLLFQTGFRIGEALSLFIEDFKFSHKGHKVRLTYRGQLENGAKLKTGEREIFIPASLMDLYDDYHYEILDELEIDTNFVFVKLRGENAGKPMTYADVESLFKRIRKKTGIDVHPHLFRHTHLSMFYQETKDIKQTQERAGHSSIQTTIQLYLHPSEEEIRKDWEKAYSKFDLTYTLQGE